MLGENGLRDFRHPRCGVRQAEKEHQCLYVGNHLSYLDIPAIGYILPASFVARKDVASWPVFGFLSKLRQTAFISRDRNDALKGKNALSKMIAQGKSLIVFPEGTSTDGRGVRDFKSSLFSIALQQDRREDLYIQPLTIEMRRVDGRPVQTQDDRDLYAWHIDMDTPLPAHLWRFARSRGAEISLTFHDSFPAIRYENRKTLAKDCHLAVSNGLTKQTA